jgi:uncharacterized protein (DUF2141 family)
MKKTILWVWLLGMSAFAPKTNFGVHNLKISIEGIPTIKGQVYVLLFNQAIGFPMNQAKAYKKFKEKVNGNKLTIQVENLPAGKYAIVAFHDANSNDALDKNWLGSPRESYGFSNIQDEFCGTPSFQQTSFEVNDKSESVVVKFTSIK